MRSMLLINKFQKQKCILTIHKPTEKSVSGLVAKINNEDLHASVDENTF
jgi:hypothetical protein